MWSNKFSNTNVQKIKLNVKQTNIKFIGKFLNEFRRGIHLKRILNQKNIKTIYTILFDASIAGFYASILGDFIQISSVRFGDNHYKVKPYRLTKVIEFLQYILIYKRSKKIIANSFAGKKTLVKDMNINPKKIIVIQNGFKFSDTLSNATFNLKKDKQIKNIGFVGRLNCIKNPFHAIYITSILSKSHKIKLLMIGREDGILTSDLNNYAKKINVDVEFIGHTEMISKYYQLMDILIVPSVETEGCSNVIIEAFSNGLPVVAYNVGDNKLLLSENRGKVIEKKLSHSFVNAVEFYLNNDDNLNDKRIQYIIDKFDVNNMVNKTKKELHL